MDIIPLSKFFVYIFVYGILAFFLNAIEVAIPTSLGITNQWVSWGLIIVTDLSAITVIIASGLRLWMVGRKRSVYQ